MSTYSELEAGQALREHEEQDATELAHLKNSLIHEDRWQAGVKECGATGLRKMQLDRDARETDSALGLALTNTEKFQQWPLLISATKFPAPRAGIGSSGG